MEPPSTNPGDGSGKVAGFARFAVRRAGWVVIAWLAFTVVMNVAVPQLEVIAGRDSSPMVPDAAASNQALLRMNEAFGSGASESFVVVAMERTSGLTGADRRFAEELATELTKDKDDVVFVQDIRSPELRKALTSQDGQARYVLVGITGATGAPSSLRQVDAVRDTVAELAPDGLTVEVTGPTATVADMATTTEDSVLRITIVSIALIGIILFLIYRSLAVPALILTVVGIGLGLGRAVVAWCGWVDVFAVSTFSGSFMTAIVLGAATDYAVFLVARYHEQRRLGVEPTQAAAIAASRIGSVVAGSAVTVVLATMCMALADLGFFNTTGPGIAVSVAVNLAVALTFTPALLALAGRRGWAEPRSATVSPFWTRLGALVAARPGRMLAASLVPLALLAAMVPLTKLSYDVRQPLPDDKESNLGFALLDRHFPINEVLPDYVIVSADHDLRTSADLALLERASATVAQHHGVALVRGITRPLGRPITQASIARQSGLVGAELGKAKDKVAGGAAGAGQLAAGADRLDRGADQLETGTGQLADGADQAVTGATRLATSTASLSRGLKQLLDGADAAVTGTGDLRTGAATLATGLSTAADQVQLAVDGLGLAYGALSTRSLTCGIDPACRQAREGIGKIWVAERDQLLPGLRRAATAARQIARGTGDLRTGLRQLRKGIQQARTGSRQLAAGQRTFRDKLGELAGGADELARGAGQLADGTGQLQGGTQEVAASLPELTAGLGRAAAFLRRTSRQAADPASAGFYLPPTALRNQSFAAASRLFLSADGRTARIAVLGRTDAFGQEASDRSQEVRNLVDASFNGTRLDGAEVVITGMPATNHELQRYAFSDLRIISICALIAVFVVLLLLLRSLVAAALLMATVVLSYLSAMGLSMLIWQGLLGVDLDWTVASIAFVVLVAVGADYNLLLTKRIHEEAPDGSPDGVARATAATGGVITSAGVIFAVSMFALLAGEVTTIGQVGFTIGLGLLLDTFVVRSLLVPALATLLGPRLWWPSAEPSATPSEG